MKPPWTERARGAEGSPEDETEQLGRADSDLRGARLVRAGPAPAPGPIRVEGDHGCAWVGTERIRPSDERDVRGVPRVLWYSDDLSFALSRRREPMAYAWRNVDADELIWIASGRGACRTEFGALAYAPGDFLVLPRGVTWRLVPAEPNGVSVQVQSRSVIEACGPADAIELPDPAASFFPEEGETEVRVQRSGQLTSFFYAEQPAVIGWRGDLFPFRLLASAARASAPLFRGQGWVLSSLGGVADAGQTATAVQRDVDRDVIVCRADDAGMLWAPAGAPRPLGPPPVAGAIALEAFAPLVVTPDVRSALHPFA